MSTAATIEPTLNRMLNLALSTSPSPGTVNFSILKTFLFELLKALKLQDFEPKFGEDTEILNMLETAMKDQTEENVSADMNNVGKIMQTDLKDRFQDIEKKINRIDNQMNALNNMPTSQEIIQKTKDVSRKIDSGPILEVWQYTQLSKRQESNEEGITKLTSILQDLIGEINDFKDFQNKIDQDLFEIKGQIPDDLSEKLALLNDLTPRIEEIKSAIDLLNNEFKNIADMRRQINDNCSRLNDHKERLDKGATKDELKEYIKWNDLESKMKDNNYNLETNKNSDNSDNSFDQKLMKLGSLNQRHEELSELVKSLKDEFGKNTGNLPDYILEKLEDLNKLQGQLDELANTVNKESDHRMMLENMLKNLNNEIESFRNSISKLLAKTQLNADDITYLKNSLNLLDEAKMDKTWILNEIKNKADLKDLSNKLNKKIFEEFNKDVTHTIGTLANKNTEIENDMKCINENISKELGGKLDRMEIDALKDHIEKQIKKLKKLQKENHHHNEMPAIPNVPGEDDAAGLRKQLLRFHCISCDRPIDLGNQTGVTPSLPTEKNFRPIQTPRPYTTYELDQIRQFQRQQFTQETSYDLFSMNRQCGGSHTLTIPHKKLLKIAQSETAESPTAPQTPVPTKNKTEIQIQGQDGQIYKGRLDAKLNVEMKKPLKHCNRSMKSAPLQGINKEQTFSDNLTEKSYNL